MIEGFQYEFLASMKMGCIEQLRVIVCVLGSIGEDEDVNEASAENSWTGGGEVRSLRFHVNVVGWVSCIGEGRWGHWWWAFTTGSREMNRRLSAKARKKKSK